MMSDDGNLPGPAVSRSDVFRAATAVVLRPGGTSGTCPPSGARPEEKKRLGDRLRMEREARGILLEQVSASTKIPRHHLEALERSDWTELVDTVFTRGYLRTYAECLGLDPDYWLKAYARELRIARIGGARTTGRSESDATETILERLAKTQGVEVPRFGSKTLWTTLCLVGASALLIAIWRPGPLALSGVESAPTSLANAMSGSTVALASSLPRLPGASATAKEDHSPSTPLRNENGSPVSADIVAIREPSPGKADSGIESKQIQRREPQRPAAPTGGVSPLAGESGLEVSEFGVGTDVEGLRLVGRSERFKEGTVAWFWTLVLHGQHGQVIRHVWLQEGRVVGITDLALGGPHWRTRSRRLLPEGSAGEWTVEARDSDGRVLASTSFTCVKGE